MPAPPSDAAAERAPAAPTPTRPPLVIGCGALAVELVALTRRAGLPEVELTCLPASLHNRPERIPAAIRSRIRRARAAGYERMFVAYADCGTGGLLDRVLEEEGVARLVGAHCYEVYAGRAAFAALADEEPGTFYLTDYLARNFERLVWRGLGLDRHPELLPAYFGNYRRLVFLAQTEDAALDARAHAAAARLGLAYERRFTGLGSLAAALRPEARTPHVRNGRPPDPAEADPAPAIRVAHEDRQPAGPTSSATRGACANRCRRVQRERRIRRAYDTASTCGVPGTGGVPAIGRFANARGARATGDVGAV